MPLDRTYRERFEGFFHEKRSPAPKFSTAARNTLLAPYRFGGGFGTEPRAPHNLNVSDVGPRGSEVPKKHTPAAHFGTSTRAELFAEGNSSSAPSYRATTPPASGRMSLSLHDSPSCSRHHNHSSSAATTTLSSSPPGPQSYRSPPTEFDLVKPNRQEQHELNIRFAQTGTHTPRAYIAGSKGGAIPRSARSTLARDPQRQDVTPGPGAYHPNYGLVK